MSEVIPLEGLLQTRAGFLLFYPSYDDDEAERRLGELHNLGVQALLMRGRHRIKDVAILGKGHVGVVVAAKCDNRLIALKIRREDADRASLEAEADNLKNANLVSVGPRFLGVSPNFLMMELIEGQYLAEWVGGLEPSESARLRCVLVSLLDRARRLDEAGLDHGELSKAHRHIIVAEDDPRIVDFESASTTRRCSNVTSLSHYIFFNRRMRDVVERLHQIPEKDDLLEALSRYKQEPTDESYRMLLEVCSLSA